tara:strand:+ start:545 stop:802 length:258 start_codon:yes stop_codon:yes gene_type:complete
MVQVVLVLHLRFLGHLLLVAVVAVVERTRQILTLELAVLVVEEQAVLVLLLDMVWLAQRILEEEAVEADQHHLLEETVPQVVQES